MNLGSQAHTVTPVIFQSADQRDSVNQWQRSKIKIPDHLNDTSMNLESERRTQKNRHDFGQSSFKNSLLNKSVDVTLPTMSMLQQTNSQLMNDKSLNRPNQQSDGRVGLFAGDDDAREGSGPSHELSRPFKDHPAFNTVNSANISIYEHKYLNYTQNSTTKYPVLKMEESRMFQFQPHQASLSNQVSLPH